MRKILLFIVYLILTICYSCTETENHKLLTSAEAIMQDNPDSAKILLDRIDTVMLSVSSKDCALYALLRSQVKDKLYDYTTDDSLINIAVDYYRRDKDLRHFMLSQYYLGRINYHSNNFSDGIVHFFKALEAAEQLDDKYWMGLSCRGIADIYNKTYNGREDVNYARKEYDYFKESGIQPYVNYALLDLCVALTSVREFDEVEIISEALLDSARLYNDDNLRIATLRQRGLSYYLNDESKKSLDSYKIICEDKTATLEDSAYLALTFVANDSLTAAESLINSLSLPHKVADIAKYELLFKQEKFKEAFLVLKDVSNYSSSLFRERMENDLNSSLHSMHHNEIISDQSKIRNLKYFIWILVLAVLLFIVTSLFIGYILYRKAKEKQYRQFQIQESLEELLKEKDMELSHNISQIQMIRNELRKILLTKYEFIDSFGRLIYENPNAKIADKKILNTVKSQIDILSKDNKIIIDLEEVVNTAFTDLMVHFRKDCPQMKEVDYNLYLLSVFKFSYGTISLFIKNESMESLYQRKKRLKQRIKKMDSDKSDYYLSFIE